jgi:hypothetical protein
MAFFTDALGFEELRDDQGRGPRILRHAVDVHVWVADGSAPRAERYLAGSASCPIQVGGVDDLYKRCKSRRRRAPGRALTDKPWGQGSSASSTPTATSSGSSNGDLLRPHAKGGA